MKKEDLIRFLYVSRGFMFSSVYLVTSMFSFMYLVRDYLEVISKHSDDVYWNKKLMELEMESHLKWNPTDYTTLQRRTQIL